MKATLLFATLSMVFAMPCKSAQTELESLRQRCQQQEQKIQQLENQLKQSGTSREGQTATPATKSAESTRPAASADTYTVKAGDTMEKIARRSGCSPTSLNKLNGLKPTSIIHPGQRIKLPAKTQIAATETRSQPSRAVSEKPVESAKIHKIKQGETYSSISLKYGIPVNTLISLNPGIKATALRPGLSIRLNNGKTAAAPSHEAGLAKTESKPKPQPASQTTTIATTRTSKVPAPSPAPAKQEPAAPTHTAKTEPTPAPEATTHTQSPASAPGPVASTPSGIGTPDANAAQPDSKVERKIRSVKIDEPMTYGQFAAMHGTDSERLNDLNGLDLTQATVLAKGSELYVPAQP